MSHDPLVSAQPVIAELDDFDRHSGSLLERALFNHRGLVVLAALLATLLLGWQALGLRLNAAYWQMVPPHHPYIVNFKRHEQDLRGFANVVRIAVAAEHGDIFDAAYLDTLRRINDEVFLMPGVDRPYMRSLWTPATRWIAVTEVGLDGGPVIPEAYAGSPQDIEQVRANIRRSGEIGRLVANDFRSSLIRVPLLDFDTRTGEPLDYAEVSKALEAIRARYEGQGVDIYITGFAKLMGDLIDGVALVLRFFAATVLLAALAVYWYTRCVRSTLLVVACSLIAVVWQLGWLRLLGIDLNPYSVLVPFLVFAIGMSHGAQKMNGVMQDIGRGTHRLVAARYTFRRLFMAGLSGLLAEAAGFAVLLVIDIPVIRGLALGAASGVLSLIVTNLVLVPVFLSYIGVSPRAAGLAAERERRERGGAEKHPLWAALDRFTRRRWALAAIVAALALGAGGWVWRAELRVGDIHPGAPELRPDSRYNRDDAYITAHYAISSDTLIAMTETPANLCVRYAALNTVDTLEWRLAARPEVEGVASFATLTRQMNAGLNEGSPLWYELPVNQYTTNTIAARASRDLINHRCDLLPVFVFLADHQADTLRAVTAEIERYAERHDSDGARVVLGGGNAGVEAATNVVVERANREMLAWVYGAVTLLCLLAFRSWRAVVCAVLPLMLTSVLAEALMAELEIGLKVATLPVVALGVGIGVDYALYILSVLLALLRHGHSLSEAYYGTLLFTGRVVMLTGFTLAVGVVTWVLSPIKFQADMGLLLAFMFLWNMVGALLLVPSLARFLLAPARRAAEQVPAARA